MSTVMTKTAVFITHPPPSTLLPPPSTLHPPPSTLQSVASSEFQFLNPALDSSQRRAVLLALSRPDVTIIHRLLGTGKTTTTIEVIVQAVGKGEKVGDEKSAHTCTCVFFLFHVVFIARSMKRNLVTRSAWTLHGAHKLLVLHSVEITMIFQIVKSKISPFNVTIVISQFFLMGNFTATLTGHMIQTKLATWIIPYFGSAIAGAGMCSFQHCSGQPGWKAGQNGNQGDWKFSNITLPAFSVFTDLLCYIIESRITRCVSQAPRTFPFFYSHVGTRLWHAYTICSCMVRCRYMSFKESDSTKQISYNCLYLSLPCVGGSPGLPCSVGWAPCSWPGTPPRSSRPSGGTSSMPW